MNYPKILENPIYKKRPDKKEYDDNIDFLYQIPKKDPYPNMMTKPFSNKEQLNKYKTSANCLTTTKYENKKIIIN